MKKRVTYDRTVVQRMVVLVDAEDYCMAGEQT